MIRRRWRLRVLAPVTLGAFVALALFAAASATMRALDSRLDAALPATDAARVLADIGEVYLTAALIILLVIVVLGITIGSALAQRVELLRSQTLARVRAGGDSVRVAPSRVAEIHVLSSAIEFLVSEFSERATVLARDRDELALLVNGVSEGILQVDADARIVRANPAARSMLNLPEQVRGQSVATLIRHVELRTLLERAARGEAMPAAEIGMDERRMLVVSRPFTESDVRGTVVAFVDLTELRRLEGVRRDFVANVSHELKTPLTSIRGYIETLLTDELSADMQHQFLDVVHKNAERLHHIVEDLLDLSRLESGGWVPELRAVDPAEIARDVWIATAEAPAAQALTFTVSGDSLPTIADPSGLRHVLTNLFDNAVRHTPAGGAISVRVRADGAGARAVSGWTVIEVQDTGSGIPRDALGRVFERFYRADPARSRAEGGTGLGLSIVKHLVERMGGVVTAESDLGKGTTVRIRLPAAPGLAIAERNVG